jgi:hypothetical protein
MKTKWTKPQLITMARSKAEEGVLTLCKYWEGGSQAGPIYAVGCQWGLGPCHDHSDS